MAKLKSSLYAYFVNTGTVAAPVWASLGKGVTSLPKSMNPQKTTETYVNEDAANTSVDSYQVSLAVAFSVWDSTSAPAHAYFQGLKDDLAVAADAETEVLEIDLNTTSPYTSKKYSAVASITDHTLTGGSAQTMSATLDYNGAPTSGTTVITAGVPVFTAAS